ncbi:hypothetical protein PSTT_01314 [Puccinia striiformis]|uniref:Kinesin motor domain-containing protein n=1 Tax=Puccinia striiformis TaxID=27350 RepID=A0A2S4W428_9BASI|nr:hypothetical protein PSTT_01314 [Puccinia striiformis]
MSNVKVVCRFRPPNALELRKRETTRSGYERTRCGGFTFDRVFPMDTKQVEVFEYGVKGIVEDVLGGYNGTVFAYGQTGSGKTFTMMGADIDSGELKGVIPRITEHIFDSIMSSPHNIEYLVKVSYMEIYMEKIRDLLAPHNDNLPIHEDKSRGVYVKNLSDFYVGSAPEVYQIMRTGGEARKVSSTIMNAESSRSHSIFVITIQQKNLETGTQKSGNLFLVDLAGSEKVGKTGASGQTLEEAKKINKSLSALGMVINALTDGKSAHIPYRDSKLTRILQESLGGNSRTTLVINCSPSAYNEAETLSTLRFGMRAKSIKNKARVNAELSSAELKALLKKAQADTGRQLSYITLLEGELTIWRNGGQVDEADWATMEKALGVKLNVNEAGSVSLGASLQAKAGGGGGRDTPSTPNSTLGRPSALASNPALDALRELGARPETPTITLERDEREEFLRRENELSDQLAEKEEALAKQERRMQEIQEELSFFKEQESSMSTENKVMAGDLNELRLQVEKLTYENKEALILGDATREQNNDLSNELEELKKTIVELKATQKSLNDEGKQRKKAEKMAVLMAGFESTALSEKEDEIRATLQKLDEAADIDRPLTNEDIILLKRQITDSQILANESTERAKKSVEEIELLSRRKEELENRLTLLEQDYEDLLERASAAVGGGGNSTGINNPNGDDLNELESIKAKLDAQTVLKREASLLEITDLKQQLDIKAHENRSLIVTIDNLKSANEELKRAFAVTAAGIEGGKDLAESAKDMERIRKTMANQLSEFDGMKKSLMRDLQNRCEKVIELEISLDETREQYNNVLRNSNSKAQQRKMEFLTRNLDQLTNVQKQLVEQNSILKKDVAIAERKLLARNDRISSLENMLIEAQDKLNSQNSKFEVQLNAVRERLNQARSNQDKIHGNHSSSTGNSSAGGLVFGRIAKPLRGGGGGGGTTTLPSNNMLKLRNELLGLLENNNRIIQINLLQAKTGDLFLALHPIPIIDRSQLSTNTSIKKQVKSEYNTSNNNDSRNDDLSRWIPGPSQQSHLSSCTQKTQECQAQTVSSLARFQNLDYHQHQHAKRLEQQHPSFASLILCAPLTNPYIHLVIILHILYMIQGVSLLIEDALIKDACFSARIHSRFRKSKSWSKSWSRFKFRFFHQYSQPGFLHPFLVWLLCVFAILLISSESFQSSQSSNASTWLDLPFRSKCNPTLDFHQEYTDPNINNNSPLTILNLLEFIFKKNSSRFLTLFNKPTKSIILIECFISCLCLLQPIQHIYRRKSSPNYIGISSIIGYLILITHIPYKSHYSIPFFLSIYWIKSFYKSIYKLITSSVNTIDCLRLVIHEFSGKSNPKQGRIKRVVSEGEDEDEDDEWTCSICFEESSDDSEDSNSTPPSPSLPPTNSSSSPPLPSTTSSPLLENDLLTSSLSTHKTSTLTKKKELRDQSNRSTLSCGHSYHTNCLVKWLHYQPFCPICHRSVL